MTKYKNKIHFISGKQLIITLEENLADYFSKPNIKDRVYILKEDTSQMISGRAIEYISSQKVEEV